MYKYAAVLPMLIIMVTAGCAGMRQERIADDRPVPSVQEISLRAADKECRERTVLMTAGDDRPWFGAGWQQHSYYEWCMEDKGYSAGDYRRLHF